MTVVKQGWRFLRTQVTWPDEADPPTLTMIGEEEEPISLEDVLATAIALGWNTPVESSDNDVNFATVEYPEGITFTIDGDEYGVDVAHQAFTAFFRKTLEDLVRRVEEAKAQP